MSIYCPIDKRPQDFKPWTNRDIEMFELLSSKRKPPLTRNCIQPVAT